MATTIPFGKHYSDPHDLVRLLKSRGLSVEDDTKAQHYLEQAKHDESYHPKSHDSTMDNSVN